MHLDYLSSVLLNFENKVSSPFGKHRGGSSPQQFTESYWFQKAGHPYDDFRFDILLVEYSTMHNYAHISVGFFN